MVCSPFSKVRNVPEEGKPQCAVVRAHVSLMSVSYLPEAQNLVYVPFLELQAI